MFNLRGLSIIFNFGELSIILNFGGLSIMFNLGGLLHVEMCIFFYLNVCGCVNMALHVHLGEG